jgi:hypothetical protein
MVPLVSAAVLVSVLPGPALGVTPVEGGAFASALWFTINDGPGDQYDPHVSGDDVSYTSDATVRFFSFLTGGDDVIRPASGLEDVLSDVDGGLVVFSRFDPISYEAYGHIYRIAEDRLGGVAMGDAGRQQTNFAIGGSTVAFIALESAGELWAQRIGGSLAQVTTDARIDRQPDVAPSGDLIVWEGCPIAASNCDVQQASWTGSGWQVSALTATGEPEANPSTDGAVVTYDAMRGGEQDIYWQPVGGGAEQRLALPGLQRNPTISRGVISFESVAPGQATGDLWLYEIATNRMFQVTSTPANEALNDVFVLSDGQVRVVWSSGDEGQRDVYGATIELPPAGPTFAFGGFSSPVDANPTLNQLKAGAAVPVKFSLGGDQGLGIFAQGYPGSQPIACDATAPVDGVEETVSAGGSSLAYDPATGLYAYVWKTDKAWAGTCRQLVLKFTDGSVARASFKLK